MQSRTVYVMPTARSLRLARLLVAGSVLPALFVLPPLFAGPAGATPLVARTVTNPAEATAPGTPVPTVPGPTTAAPTTPSNPVPPTVDISPKPPTAPTDLRVTGVTSTTVTLAWTAAAGGCCGVDGYDVTVLEAFNDAVQLRPVGNVTTATINSGIRPTGQYTFWVTARDSVGHRSGSSNSVSVVTPASDTATDRTPPSAPTALGIDTPGASGPGSSPSASPVPPVSPSATPVPNGTDSMENGTVTPFYTPAPGYTPVAWVPSTDNVGVTGYDVYRFDGLYVSTLLATVTTSYYTVPPGGNGPMNIIYVRARDAAGNLSAASNLLTLPNSTSSSPTPPPAPSCRVTYKNTSQWHGGFVAEVAVSNTGAAAVNGWALNLTFGGDQRVANSWNATYSQAGSSLTLTGLSWNRTLPAGGSVTAGLLGSFRSSNAAPTAATLNGVACLVG